MLLLVSVNIFLYFKLNQIDQNSSIVVQWICVNIFCLFFFLDILLKMNRYPKEDNQWSILLKREEQFYEQKLHGLHQILISIHDALKNVCFHFLNLKLNEIFLGH